jgi:hypothetical protein
MAFRQQDRLSSLKLWYIRKQGGFSSSLSYFLVEMFLSKKEKGLMAQRTIYVKRHFVNLLVNPMGSEASQRTVETS